MTGVVLRCPNCGTTRGAPGECEACHEAQVRYYCTNHAPGRWLDAPACAQCGARFGVAAPPPAPAAPRAPRRNPAPARPPAPAAPTSRPRYRPAEPPRPGTGMERPERPRPAPEREFDLRDSREFPEARAPRPTSLQELILAAARARSRSREAGPYPGAAPTGRGLGGCLGRFVLLVVFFFLALVSGLFLFGGSLLRLFFPF